MKRQNYDPKSVMRGRRLGSSASQSAWRWLTNVCGCVAVWACTSCAASSHRSALEIDPRIPLAELDADQARTLCDHGIERATQRLGPAVGEIVCNDQTRSFEWTVNCDFLWHVPAGCRAIVDDVLTCLTQLLDLVRENRCLIAGLEPRVDLGTFVADIPDCNRLTECVQSAP